MRSRYRSAVPLQRRAFVVLIILLLCVGQPSACRDITSSEILSSISRLRLTVGSQVVDAYRSGEVTGGPISISAGSAVSYTAELLDYDDEHIPHPTAFRLEVTSGSSSVVEIEEDGLSGRLRGVGSGETRIYFVLWTREERGCSYREEDDFAVDVPVTVR
jgi:hypothetical protein